MLTFPQALHGGEFALHVRVPGHKERPRRIPFAQDAQAVVELLHQGLHLLHRALCLHRTGQAPGLHAHAAGLVDGRRAPFELPGHPQRQADGGQRQHQQRCADADELGGQGCVADHAVRLAGLTRGRHWARGQQGHVATLSTAILDS